MRAHARDGVDTTTTPPPPVIGIMRRKEVVSKDYMERIMDEESDWDHEMERGGLEGLYGKDHG